MLDQERVFHLFTLFADLEEDAALRYRPLCDGAAALFSRRARQSLPPEDLERLATAAAGCAYCDWLDLTGGALSAEEIKVGDIALKSSSGGGKAATAQLRTHFGAMAEDLLCPPFVFGQIGSGEESV